MKISHVPTYTCEICGESYGSADKALFCESKSVTEEKGVRVGDTVKITRGEGAGHFAKVTSVSILSKDWGHYQWERYWHTVCVTADLIDHFGSRVLTFDNYDTV